MVQPTNKVARTTGAMALVKENRFIWLLMWMWKSGCNVWIQRRALRIRWNDWLAIMSGFTRVVQQWSATEFDGSKTAGSMPQEFCNMGTRDSLKRVLWILWFDSRRLVLEIQLLCQALFLEWSPLSLSKPYWAIDRQRKRWMIQQSFKHSLVVCLFGCHSTRFDVDR